MEPNKLEVLRILVGAGSGGIGKCDVRDALGLPYAPQSELAQLMGEGYAEFIPGQTRKDTKWKATPKGSEFYSQAASSRGSGG